MPRWRPERDAVDGGDRFLRLRAVVDRLTHSLFFVPAVFVAGSIGLALVVLAVDRRLRDQELPDFFETSVSSARTMLGVLAGGTITAASIVFSLTLVTVQLASSQYSPRTLHNFLGDRFQQVVIGIVLGTFSFCLVTLRGIDASAETPFVPRITVASAWMLGVIALFAVVASINHTARGLRVATIANDITDETIEVIRRRFGEDGERPLLQSPVEATSAEPEPTGPHDAVLFGAPRRGWIQQFSLRLIVAAVPEGSTVRVVANTGDYVQEGQPVLSVSPVPSEPERVLEQLTKAIVVGPHRTLQQDVAFGIIQLTDIALRALSPGVNDPQTAQEVLPRLTSVLTEILVRDLTPERVETNGCVIIRATDLDHRDFVQLAVEPVRRAARHDPAVLGALIVALAAARDETLRRRPGADVAALAEQVDLLLRELDEATTEHDVRMVRDAARRAGFCS